MSGKTEKTDWSKLTVVQLKGALARRALSSAGTKEELVERMQEYEENASKDNAEMEVEDKTSDMKPMLPRAAVSEGRRLIATIKTVIVDPFKVELMQNPGFVSWLEETASYSIKKNSSGVSAAELVYPTTDKGDIALTDLKTIVGEEVEVYHPQYYRFDCILLSPFDMKVDDKPKELFWDRVIVLENLPAQLNTEEKLDEFFPEAYQAFSFQFDKMSKGIAILEFSTGKAMSEYLKSVGRKILLEGQEVKVSKYTDRSVEWSILYRSTMKKDIEEETLIKSDEGRVGLNSELNHVTQQLDGIEQSDELVGYEKIAKISELKHRKEYLTHLLKEDTKTRMGKDEFTMPEPEDEMQEFTKGSLLRKKGEKPILTDLDSKLEKLTMLEGLEKENLHQNSSLKQAINSVMSTLPIEVRRERRKATQTQSSNQTANKQAKSDFWKAHTAKKQAIAKLSNRGGGQQQSGRKDSARQNGQSGRGGNQGKQNSQDDNIWGIAGQRGGNQERQNSQGDNIWGIAGQVGRGGNRGRQNRQGDNQWGIAGQVGRGGNRGTQNKQDDNQWGIAGSKYSNTQKRQAGRTNTFDEPPQKMNRGNRQDRSGSYGRRSGSNWDDYGDETSRRNRRRSDPYADNYRDGSSDSMKLIEGITSALTDKMKQLENMQTQTLQAQASMLSANTGYGIGYGNTSTSGSYSTPSTMGKSSMYGFNTKSSYTPSSNSQTYNMGSSGSKGYGGNTASQTYGGVSKGYGGNTASQTYGGGVTAAGAYGYGNVKSGSGAGQTTGRRY